MSFSSVFVKQTASLLQFPSATVIGSSSLRVRPILLQVGKSYSSKSSSKSTDEDEDEDEFESARKWWPTFNEATIPPKMADTEYVKSSGPGGQKTNKSVSRFVGTLRMLTLAQDQLQSVYNMADEISRKGRAKDNLKWTTSWPALCGQI